MGVWRATQTLGRGLQLACDERTAINTTFNNDDRIPTYTGMMFELYPNMDLELLTLEFDVRIPSNDTDPDLWVEVYTLLGSYDVLDAYDAPRWTLLTETNAVILPGGQGAIIPAGEFPPLEMTLGARRSFYVTFRRSYLDFNAAALDKTGELQLSTPEFDLLVGVGFHEYKFPGDYDRVLDPQFAGVIHVRRSAECSLFTEDTRIEYPFLVESDPTPELSQLILDGVTEALDTLMTTDPTFLTLASKYDLEQRTQARTSLYSNDGGCPSDWTDCPNRYFLIDVVFSHLEELASGDLQYEFYRAWESVNTAVEEQLKLFNFLYVGLTGVSADVTLSLAGTPEYSMMDSAQIQYFEDVTVSFLEARTDPSARVFALKVDSQIRSRMLRHGRGLQEDLDLRVTGKIYGAQGLYYDNEDFRTSVEDTFRTGQKVLLDSVRLNGLRPSDVNEENRMDLFNSITSIGANVRVDEEPIKTPATSDNPVTNNKTLALVLTVVLVGAVVCLVVWMAYYFWREYQKFADVEEDKERMKELRKRRSMLDRVAQRKQSGSDENGGESFDRAPTPITNSTSTNDGSPTKDFGYESSSGDPPRPKTSDNLDAPHANSYVPQYAEPAATPRQRAVRRSSSFDESSHKRNLPRRNHSADNILADDEEDDSDSNYETVRTGGLYRGVLEPKKGETPKLPKSSLGKFLAEEESRTSLPFISKLSSNRSTNSAPAYTVGNYSGVSDPNARVQPELVPLGGDPGPRTTPRRNHSGSELDGPLRRGPHDGFRGGPPPPGRGFRGGPPPTARDPPMHSRSFDGSVPRPGRGFRGGPPPSGRGPPLHMRSFDGISPPPGRGFRGRPPPSGRGPPMHARSFDGTGPPPGFRGGRPPSGRGPPLPARSFDGTGPPPGFRAGIGPPMRPSSSDGTGPPPGFRGGLPPSGRGLPMHARTSDGSARSQSPPRPLAASEPPPPRTLESRSFPSKSSGSLASIDSLGSGDSFVSRDSAYSVGTMDTDESPVKRSKDEADGSNETKRKDNKDKREKKDKKEKKSKKDKKEKKQKKDKKDKKEKKKAKKMEEETINEEKKESIDDNDDVLRIDSV